MQYKVFLSHSSKDKPWVEWVATNVKNLEIDVYLYEHDLQPGKLIADKLELAIKNSDALVVLLTNNSQVSAYVQQEIGYAKASDKQIIPLVQPNINEQNLALLEGREHIPFDFSNPKAALSSLLNHLQKLKEKKKKDRAILWGIGIFIILALLLSSNK